MSDLLIQAMTARQNGNINLAKQLISQAIVQDPRNEGAWMLMAEIVEDAKLRRNCLERVLAINPDNIAASLALTKLNTSPLTPIVRGERNKPIDTSQAEKTPPFTPPFTWDGQPEQYLALGDMTFPEIPTEESNPLPEVPPTFDWANESAEPDKAIDKIFEAVSKPELVSEPPPQKESNWLDNLRPDEEMVETPPQKTVEPPKEEDPWLSELVGSDTGTPQEQRTLTREDFAVSAEPELGLQAFAPMDSYPASSEEPDSLLWDNPRAKSDRLVMLSYRSLIYAHPSETDIPHILGLFKENRMVRDLLGDNAYMIKLDNIKRVTANPKAASMEIEYTPNGKTISHQLTFSSPKVRDEVLSALKFRLGAEFSESSHHISMEDKILSPIFFLLLVATIAWVLVWGLPLLSTLQGFNTGSPQVILASLQRVVEQIGKFYILLVAGLIGLGCIAWMVLNLRKPESLVILER